MGYDLANGLFLTRLSTYWKAARASGRRGYFWALLVGLACYVTNVVLLLAVAAAAYWGMWSLKSVTYDPKSSGVRLPDLLDWTYCNKEQWEKSRDKPKEERPGPGPSDMSPTSLLGYPYVMGLCGIAVFAVISLLLWRQPALLWVAVLGGTTAAATLIPFLASIWQGSVVTLLLLIPGLVVVPAAYGTGAVIASATHFSLLAVYLAASSRVRGEGHAWKTFFLGAWKNCGYESGVIVSVASLMILLALVVMIMLFTGCVVFLVIPICQVLSDVSHLPFHPFLNAVIVIALAIALGKSVSIWRSHSRAKLNPLPLLSRVRPGVIRKKELAIAAIWALGPGALFGLFCLFSTAFGVYFLRFLAILLSAVGVVLLAYCLWVTVRFIARFMGLHRNKFTPGSFPPEGWKRRLEAAGAHVQASLLLRTDHQALSLTPAQFLEVLKEVRPKIKEDPALSTYWALRDQLEQTLRQERHG
jgi:hypothetical protein